MDNLGISKNSQQLSVQTASLITPDVSQGHYGFFKSHLLSTIIAFFLAPKDRADQLGQIWSEQVTSHLK